MIFISVTARGHSAADAETLAFGLVSLPFPDALGNRAGERGWFFSPSLLVGARGRGMGGSLGVSAPLQFAEHALEVVEIAQIVEIERALRLQGDGRRHGFAILISVEARASRYQLADDHVLLQAMQGINLAPRWPRPPAP